MAKLYFRFGAMGSKIVTLCYNFGEILEVILWQSYTLDLVQWEVVKL